MDKTVVCSFKTGKADMIPTWLVRRDYRVQKVEYVIYCIFTIYCIHVLCCKKNALNTKRMVPLYVWLFNTTHTDSQIDKHSHPRYYVRSSNPTSDSKICYPRASSNLKKHSMTVSSVMIKIIHKQQVCTTSYNCFS